MEVVAGPGYVSQWPGQFKGLNLFDCLFNTFIYIEIGGTGGIDTLKYPDELIGEMHSTQFKLFGYMIILNYGDHRIGCDQPDLVELLIRKLSVGEFYDILNTHGF